jgi:GNAT superfamily N-acetyltransferase
VDVVARGAVAADSKELERLRRASLAEAAGERGGRLLARAELGSVARAPQPERQGSSDLLCGVGEIDGVPVGFVDATLVELPDGATVARVEMIYVEPDARDVGVGDELMTLVSAWAARCGAEGIDVLALPGTRETKNFFEAHGFVTRLLVMHHRLE